MQYGAVGVVLSLSLVGCLNAGPGSTGTRSCAQLGWACGVDDLGVSCGSCFAPQTCSVGSCVDPGAQVIASGATAFAVAGGYAGVFFTLPAAALVRFDATSPGLFQAGVFTLSDWTLFASGQASDAFVLTNPSPSAREAIRLPAGTYTLGFRCANTVDSCLIRYGINATY
ncbi:MAG: hypothetical protein Q8S73_13705 [Deltaproteobacteria bacterium]|nr:hypothetical protein [Myxococcales bacterium]MDP3215156.1 hypothetical protein [Deltaproteobacteria bacterium]